MYIFAGTTCRCTAVYVHLERKMRNVVLRWSAAPPFSSILLMVSRPTGMGNTKRQVFLYLSKDVVEWKKKKKNACCIHNKWSRPKMDSCFFFLVLTSLLLAMLLRLRWALKKFSELCISFYLLSIKMMPKCHSFVIFSCRRSTLSKKCLVLIPHKWSCLRKLLDHWLKTSSTVRMVSAVTATSLNDVSL